MTLLLGLFLAAATVGEAPPAPKLGLSGPAATNPEAARARYERTEEAWAEYRALPLEGAGPELKRSMQRKAKALNELVRLCDDVVGASSPPWTLAALVRAGEAYLEFDTRLRAVPPPEEVTRLGPEAAAAYRKQLDEQAQTLRDRARDFFQRAAAVARAEGLHTPEAAQAERRLAELAR